MRQNFKVISMVLFFVSTISAQMPLHDAVRLKKQYQDGQIPASPEVIGILSKYVRPGASANDIARAFAVNPFFKLEGDIEAVRGSAPASVLSTLAGADITTIAEAFVGFLIGRAKDELSVAFFDKMRTVLSEQEELKTLFPLTSNVLIMVDPIYYATFLQSLRESFGEDLKSFFTNLSSMLQQPKYRSWFKSDTLRALILNTLPVADELGGGENPVDVMKNLGRRMMTDANTRKVGFGISTVTLFVASLRAPESSGRMWSTAEEVRNSFGDTVTVRIYLGLLYQQAEGIEYGRGADVIRLREVLRNFLYHYEQIKSPVALIADRAEAVESMLKKYHSMPRETRIELFLQYISSFNMFFELSLKSLSALVPRIDAQKGSDDLGTYTTYVSRLNLLYVDVKSARYSSAVIGAAALMQSVIGKDSLGSFIGNFVKYGSFAATLVEAKNPNEVQAVIESVVLPAGSSSIKRKSLFNVSLNSYLGGYWGEERIENGDAKLRSHTFGMYAPLGVAVSFPAIYRSIGTLSLFGSLIDVGGLTAYRLENDNAASLPKVKLENLFAPGLAVIYNIPSVPLSVGGTVVQRGPTIRSISDAADPIENNKSLRIWSLFVVVDIPLFSFYTKPGE